MWMGLLLTAQLSCPQDVAAWASRLTSQLPRYTNLIFTRNRLGYRMTRVGEPELERVSDTQVRLWFMTVERDATADLTLQRAYQLDVSQTAQGWQIEQIQVAQSGTLAPRDASFGTVAQAIAMWQRDQCPATFRIRAES